MSVNILLHKAASTQADIPSPSNLRTGIVFVNSKEDGHWHADSSRRCNAFVFSLNRVFTARSATELALQIAQAVDMADTKVAYHRGDVRSEVFTNALYARTRSASGSATRTEY